MSYMKLPEIKSSLQDAFSFLGKGRVSKREFCFWLVPAGSSSSVKKIRLALWQIVLVFTLSSSLIAFLIIVACDYLRLHGATGKTYATLKKTLYQRDSLIGNQDDLRGKISSFLSAQAAQDGLNRELEESLSELESFLRDAKAIHPQEIRKFQPKIKQSKEAVLLEQAVGGLESKCSDDSCSIMEDDLLGDIANNQGARASLGISNHSQLQLDRLSDALKVLRAVPLLVPVQGDISSGYGFRWSPFDRGVAKHQGIDFAAPTGTAIGVAGDGIVKEVARDSTYGILIDVEHTSRITTRYAHLSAALVAKGDKLLRGDLIGQVGSTGRSTGPHLHYEVIVDGKQVNPSKYLKLADRLAQLM
jgi:murein DD-endopeptidase MepM/ murein hydrolase activator NlpD